MNWDKWNAHPDDRRFIDRILARAPEPFWFYIQRFYNDTITKKDRYHANMEMLDLEDLLKSVNIRLASDDQDIRDRAANEAKSCGKIIAKSRSEQHAILRLERLCQSIGIPTPQAKTTKGILARYSCEKWWRRKLRVLYGQTIEKIALKLNIVNKRGDIYISESSVKRRRSQKRRNNILLDELEAINEAGDSFTLLELAEKSVSNPKLRRAELMTRIAGNEKIAEELGHAGEFYTLTCPSRMHASHSKSCKPNPKYDGTTPKEAQNYLRTVWSQIRTALSHKNISIYGIRVTEPHHDGTPHWHFLLFVDPKDKEELRMIFKKYALKTDGDEKGANEYRFKPVSIDKTRGSATGYIAKYISKNIDGHGIDSDLYGHDAKSSAERIEAYASTWGLRQFQFFGNPPVSVWRELRRLKESDNKIIDSAIKAADDGNWAEFIKIMGGPCASKKIMPISIMRMWSDQSNSYDEPIGYRIIGVELGEQNEVSRIHVWEIKRKPMEQEAFSGGVLSPPWSSVNNCTGYLY